jgi:hypothetical protein
MDHNLAFAIPIFQGNKMRLPVSAGSRKLTVGS